METLSLNDEAMYLSDEQLSSLLSGGSPIHIVIESWLWLIPVEWRIKIATYQANKRLRESINASR